MMTFVPTIRLLDERLDSNKTRKEHEMKNTSASELPRLGIDIGRVLIAAEGTDGAAAPIARSIKAKGINRAMRGELTATG